MGNILYSASEILFKDANVLIHWDLVFSQAGNILLALLYFG